MGKEVRYKKEVKEVEIYRTLGEEELFLCHVHPSLSLLILAYGTSCATTLGQKYTRKCLHASDYSARTARNDILGLLHTIKHLHFLLI